MGVLDQLAAFVSTAKSSDLPAEDRAMLRRHVADVVAARVAGGACSEGKAVAAFYPAGHGADSIAGLAALVRLTETDDIHIATGTTPSSVAVPVALGLAAAESCSGERLESAIWVGVEMVVRLARAAGGAAILYQGIWPTRAGATLGAAAAACRVWGLPEQTTKDALSLAILLTSGRTGRFEGEPSGRWILFATAVAAGVRAAQAARAGFSGDHSVLDSSWLERALGVPVETQSLVRDLGRGSVLSELSLKPYCTARQALPGAEAMRALLAEGVDPDDIASFVIKVPSAYAGMISQKLDPSLRASAYVSGAGLAAIAALDPASLYDVERMGVLSNPRVVALAAKGSVVPDAELDRLYPDRWPARLEVTTTAGRIHKIEVMEPSGDPRNPMAEAAVEEKSRRMLGHVGRSSAIEPLSELTRRPFETEVGASRLARFFVAGGAA